MEVIYQVAVCDDEAKQMEQEENMLKEYARQRPDCEFKIECFRSVDRLIRKMAEQEYAPELVLLDIYMPEKTGIAAAQEIRKMGCDCRIILITTSKEHALEAFGVGASQYLIKPLTEEVLFLVLDRIRQDMKEKKRKYLLLRIEGNISRIPLHDILYCEAQGKRQHLYLEDGTKLTLRTTMTEISQRLSDYSEFVKVGAAYLVNLEHVKSLNAKELCLDNGKRLYLPRGAYQQLREKYFQYYCEEEM